jgi:hypothetical protein
MCLMLAHLILKRGLQASTRDLLSAILSFEQTLSYQHQQFEQNLADQPLASRTCILVPFPTYFLNPSLI